MTKKYKNYRYSGYACLYILTKHVTSSALLIVKIQLL